LTNYFNSYGAINSKRNYSSFRISKKRLVQLYVEERKTLIDIAEQFSVSKTTVSNWCDVYGIQKRKTGKFVIPNDSIARAISLMYEEKEMSINEISRELGFSTTYVRSRLKSMGVKRRTKSEALKIRSRKCMSKLQLQD